MPLRFLLLEDSLLDAELIHANLAAGGIVCELVQVTNRAEYQTALTEKFDLILADYSLPGFDGMTALQISQDLGLDIPFIFVTATLGEELAIETLKSGATDYVLKQRLERLVHSVQRALREAEERRLYQQAQQALQASETQLRAQTAQLQEANQLKDQFLAILSHELRSPLNAILGWSKLLRTRKFDEITFNRALEIIERNATLQTKLIEDLLDISRIIRGKLTLDSQPTNLIEPINAAIDNIRLAAEAKSIDLQFVVLDFEQDDSPLYLNHIYSEQKDTRSKNSKFCVSGDANRLQQIFWNLISNAIKFTPAGGQVDICLEEVASCAQITVKDTGKGIPQEFIPHVFDSFRQADGSITRNHGGLGLGLAIVRHLVELHGGIVSVESPGEGKGATFAVQLPLLNKADRNQPGITVIDSSVALKTQATPLTGMRILVVDDEPDTQEFLVFALQEYGAEATAVGSAEAAMQALASFQPNLLLSDIGMPDEDGYALIRRLRSHNIQIPAIALTAYARSEDRLLALEAGFQSHLAKPIEPQELIATLVKFVTSAVAD